jgi:hypothetical protein
MVSVVVDRVLLASSSAASHSATRVTGSWGGSTTIVAPRQRHEHLAPSRVKALLRVVKSSLPARGAGGFRGECAASAPPIAQWPVAQWPVAQWPVAQWPVAQWPRRKSVRVCRVQAAPHRVVSRLGCRSPRPVRHGRHSDCRDWQRFWTIIARLGRRSRRTRLSTSRRPSGGVRHRSRRVRSSSNRRRRRSTGDHVHNCQSCPGGIGILRADRVHREHLAAARAGVRTGSWVAADHRRCRRYVVRLPRL